MDHQGPDPVQMPSQRHVVLFKLIQRSYSSVWGFSVHLEFQRYTYFHKAYVSQLCILCMLPSATITPYERHQYHTSQRNFLIRHDYHSRHLWRANYLAPIPISVKVVTLHFCAYFAIPGTRSRSRLYFRTRAMHLARDFSCVGWFES